MQMMGKELKYDERCVTLSKLVVNFKTIAINDHCPQLHKRKRLRFVLSFLRIAKRNSELLSNQLDGPLRGAVPRSQNGVSCKLRRRSITLVQKGQKHCIEQFITKAMANKDGEDENEALFHSNAYNESRFLHLQKDDVPLESSLRLLNVEWACVADRLNSKPRSCQKILEPVNLGSALDSVELL